MAVHVTDQGSVGCVYYVAREHKLYFMEDAQLGGADVVDLRKYNDSLVWYTLTKAEYDCTSTRRLS